MGFSHLPGTPEPLPSPYPVAILCNGQSCLGSPALWSIEHRRLDACLFPPFQGILFIPAYLCSCCSLHQNTLLGPIYQPEVIWSRRDVWVWVSALHLAVWIWANYLTSLRASVSPWSPSQVPVRDQMRQCAHCAYSGSMLMLMPFLWPTLQGPVQFNFSFAALLPTTSSHTHISLV